MINKLQMGGIVNKKRMMFATDNKISCPNKTNAFMKLYKDGINLVFTHEENYKSNERDIKVYFDSDIPEGMYILLE